MDIIFCSEKCRNGTQLLGLSYEFQVVAVDPAELDPKVLALPNVKHVQKKVEDDLDLIRSFSPYDFIVSDMCNHGPRVRRL